MSETNAGGSMPFSLEYVRHSIAKIASDTTGDDVDALLQTGRLAIGPRDAVEFFVRLEAVFDCTLGRMRYEALSIEIDQLAVEVLAAAGAQSHEARPI